MTKNLVDLWQELVTSLEHSINFEYEVFLLPKQDLATAINDRLNGSCSEIVSLEVLERGGCYKHLSYTSKLFFCFQERILF